MNMPNFASCHHFMRCSRVASWRAFCAESCMARGAPIVAIALRRVIFIGLRYTAYTRRLYRLTCYDSGLFALPLIGFFALLAAFWFAAQFFGVTARLGGHVPSTIFSFALLL